MNMNDSKEDNCPILVIHATESEGVWAIMGRRKGDDKYIVRRATEILTKLGYMNMAFTSGQEQSLGEAERVIRDNLPRIREHMGHSMNVGAYCQVVVMNSAARESASHGIIEHAIQRI